MLQRFWHFLKCCKVHVAKISKMFATFIFQMLQKKKPMPMGRRVGDHRYTRYLCALKLLWVFNFEQVGGLVPQVFFFATFEIQMLQKFSKSLQHELCNILESFKILATWTLQHYSIFSKSLQHCFATITNVAKNNIKISFSRGRVWDLQQE